jgi:hypothetical protein
MQCMNVRGSLATVRSGIAFSDSYLQFRHDIHEPSDEGRVMNLI